MTFRIAFSIAAAVFLAAGAAEADTLTSISPGGTLLPGQGWFSTGPGQTPTTITGSGVNNGVGIKVNDLTGAGAGSFLFSQTFTAPNASFAAPNQINGNSYGFVSSYVIDVPPAMENAFGSLLKFGSRGGTQN